MPITGSFKCLDMFVNAQENMSHLMRFYLLTLLLYPIVSSSFSNSSLQLCHHDHSFALLQIKNSFSINSSLSASCITSYPKILSWKENKDCCSWDGVTCDRVTGHVIGLDLSCSWLQGTIDSNSSLFLLPHLQRLNLAYNDFLHSPISSEFGGFASLTHFNLSWSNFAGHIPSEISHLSKLVSLDLSGNLDISTLFSLLGLLRLNNPNLKKLVQNLTELRILDLSYVDMSSVDPSSLMNLSSSLTTLNLIYCGLRGKFPSNIFSLANMQKLYLGYNHDLTGYLPKINRSNSLEDLHLQNTSFSEEPFDSISNLQSLKSLDLSDCNFSGSVPASLGNLTQIHNLMLSSNNFIGQIPWSLSKLGHLIKLDLSKNYFIGSIPTSLGNLTQISFLRLSSNNFSGQIPSSLSKLEELTFLDLSDNHFSGSIPTSLGNLTQISFLRLSSNNFSGQIPSSLSKLEELTFLDLSYNHFSGSIQTWLGNFTQIYLLSLFSNNFSGQIPSSLSKFEELFFLALFDNHFCGSIPAWFGNLTQLEILTLFNNDFSGQIPTSLSKLKQLTTLDLSNNHFNGFTSTWGGNFPQLFSLDLSYNNFSGQIPSWLDNFAQLSSLSLASNSFSGQIPSGLGDLIQLESLDLSSNNFSGTIPPSLSKLDRLTYLNLSINHLNGSFSSSGVEQFPWKSIKYLDLHTNKLQGPLLIPPLTTTFFSISDNRLTGEIPSLICNASSLEILNLSNNNLSGIIPQCLGNFARDLSVLDLRMNSFHGTIPNTFVKGNALRNIALNGNQLKGPIPRSMINCRKLQVLDLGNNKINDTFPYWLENLPELQVLVLRFNSFHGSIRGSKFEHPFPKLRIFDVSNNDFNGPLPTKYFKNLKAMMNVNEKKYERRYMGDRYYQDSVIVTIKGLDIKLVKILTIFTVLDFSNNKFRGEIPNLIGNLISLRLLNISHNNLGSQIPSSLGNLSNLESLDLSSNNLSGKIPEELTSLNFLSVLNLSQNHLKGPIPRGPQFNTFENKSFDGNLGLCGAPLLKKCNDDEAPQPPPFILPKEDDPGFVNGFEWKVVAVGYGCGTVFGLAMGYFIFLIGKPKWFVRMVEGKHYRMRKLKKAHRRGGRRN